MRKIKKIKTNVASSTKKSEEVEKSAVENRSSKQCERNWNKFKTLCSDNELGNPTLIDNNAVKSTKLCLALKSCTEGLGFKVAEAARS